MASRIGLRMQVRPGFPQAEPPIITGCADLSRSGRERETMTRVFSFLLRLNTEIASYLFLQLMRDQLQQEEQRERQQQQNAALQYMQHRMAGPPAPTPAISTPQHYQNMQVPIEVLKVSNSLCRHSESLKTRL